MLGFGLLPDVETNVVTQGCITDFGGENLFQAHTLKKKVAKAQSTVACATVCFPELKKSLQCLPVGTVESLWI